MNRAALGTLAFATFALGFGELMIAGILPAIAADTRVSISLAGQLVTVYALVFALLSPPLALLLRRVAAKRVLIASLSVVALANGIAAAADAFTTLILARVLAAAGSAVATPLALAAVDRISSNAYRGRAHGIVFTGFSLAAMLGVPLGTLVATQHGWRATFVCVAGLSGCAALATAALLPPSPAARRSSPATIARILSQPRLRRALLISALFLTSIYTVFTYFRPYFEQAGGVDVPTVMLLFFFYGALGMLGTLVGGVLVDRYGARRTLIFAVGSCGVVLAALPFLVRNVVAASLAVGVWALTSWGFSPAINRELTLVAAEVSDVALALNLTAFNLGIAIGSALGGATISLAGIEPLPFVAAVLSGIALIVARKVRD